MTTKVQLRDKVLKKLGVDSQGTTVSSSDATIVDEAIDDEHSYLEFKANIDWTTADMPEEIILSLRDRVAFRVADQFPPAQVSGEEFDRGLIEIREFMLAALSGQPVQTDYF